MPQIPVTTRIATDRPLVKVDNSAVANPAAAQGFSITVPVGYRFTPVSLFMRMVTDANVAVRYVTLELISSSGVMFRYSTPFGQSESETRYISFAPGVAQVLWSIAVFTSIVPLPLGVTLQEGDAIVISVLNMQAGDQISLINSQILSQFVAE